MKTQLYDRSLWFDSTTEINPDDLEKFKILGYRDLCVTHVDQKTIQFNRVALKQLIIKTQNVFSDNILEFCIPDEYKYMQLDEYFIMLYDRIQLDQLYTHRVKRFYNEIELYEKHGLLEYIPVLKYVIDTMTQHEHVIGCGRGSSTSSYILFLMGFHLVDCVKYDININDFIKE